MHYRQLIALLIVCAHLFLPLDSFANLEPPFPATLQNSSSLAAIASRREPIPHRPCSDRHATDCCNSSCSCCSSFVVPLPAVITRRAIAPAASFSMREPFKRFPEVYLPIFVPPQNRS